MDFSFFNQLLIIFCFSVAVIGFFHRLRLPDTLAYLVVGLVLGPTATGVIDSSFDISLLAEIGVVFLLFSLGLEFSMAHMFAMRRIVFGLGGLQVLISTGIIAAFGFLMHFSMQSTFVMAAGLALSSTAIVSKELSRRNEIKSSHGQLAIGTLIFQDLAAVVFLIIVSALGQTDDQSLVSSLLIAMVKGGAFVVVTLYAGRRLMPRLFHEIAKTRSEELFVLTVIVVALLAAWLTHLLSLSMALGGFVAGMVLGESHYRHQIKAEIQPFRDILLGLFFVSVGFMVDLQLFMQHWLMITLAAIALIFVKCFLVFQLSYFLVKDARTSFRAGLALAQGGEFCFALVAVAGQNGVLSSQVSAIILSVTILSMVVTPFLIRYSAEIASFFLDRKQKHRALFQTNSADVLKSEISALKGHILICGYGRVGQAISRFLEKDFVPFVALDDDAVRTKEAVQAKKPVFYGDCRRSDILLAAGLERARMVVICIDRSKDALQALQVIRSITTALPVMVRTRDDSMMDTLLQNGATQVVPEVLESSLLIVGHVLSMLGQPERQIQRRLQIARREHYHLLHNYFFGLNDELHNSEGEPQRFMHGITLSEHAYAVGLSLTDITVRNSGAMVECVTRGENKTPVSWNDPLQAGDVIMLSGTPEQVEHGESILLSGK